MKKEEFEIMYAAEDVHWWYQGLHTVVLTLLRKYRISPYSGRVLDAGCGTGGLMRHLAAQYAAVGMDISPFAIDVCRERRKLGTLVLGSVTGLPFGDCSFSAIVSNDVISDGSTRDDDSALKEFHRVLKPGGILLLNLPAYEQLRGEHDLAVDTVRRYTRTSAARKLLRAGFRVEKVSYRNMMLLPLVAAVRLGRSGDKKAAGARSDIRTPPQPLNSGLAALVSLEARLVKRLDLPFGSSLICVARKV